MRLHLQMRTLDFDGTVGLPLADADHFEDVLRCRCCGTTFIDPLAPIGRSIGDIEMTTEPFKDWWLEELLIELYQNFLWLKRALQSFYCLGIVASLAWLSKELLCCSAKIFDFLSWCEFAQFSKLHPLL